jgi:hypothetical protein
MKLLRTLTLWLALTITASILSALLSFAILRSGGDETSAFWNGFGFLCVAAVAMAIYMERRRNRHA